jgi:hypothetical protein
MHLQQISTGYEGLRTRRVRGYAQRATVYGLAGCGLRAAGNRLLAIVSASDEVEET